jgi:hypothetical protein
VQPDDPHAVLSSITGTAVSSCLWSTQADRTGSAGCRRTSGDSSGRPVFAIRWELSCVVGLGSEL